jgi:hypothetical protein
MKGFLVGSKKEKGDVGCGLPLQNNSRQSLHLAIAFVVLPVTVLFDVSFPPLPLVNPFRGNCGNDPAYRT